ncbi:putative transferase At1g60990, chloroplastic isoform X1 [Cynara cardunculus var. scolymus]|uniref:putative transferase At1g60990, chloroplastic isoform X1 n=1 Tax=Cynara cardunculus var. scolymus TaxID=59895 RepID=UPI000D624E9F|nr:putative transferase At1g60990, chloroplastic isoform X1 [Cynara cardunculus var. scolymus]
MVGLLSSVSHAIFTPTTSTLHRRSVNQTRCCRLPSSSFRLSMFSSLGSQSNAVCIFSRKPLSSTTDRAPLAAIPFDIYPPPIDHDLHDDMAIAGVKVSEDWVIETFDNDEEALDVVDNGTVVVDLSHYGRLRVSGEDRIQFLHNQSTANFEALSEGGGCDTVFVTPTARTIDIAQAWIMKTAVTLVVSPLTSGSISEMLKKYIFFADKVEIQDISEKTCLFALVGPKSNQVMVDLNLGDLIGQPYGSHKHYNASHFFVGGNPVTVAVGSVVSEEGFSLLMSPAGAGLIWKTLLSHGATPMGSNAWETYRILQGRPAPGSELTDEFNVLEAGLWNAVSLNKGCYKGQETISRLITYDGIKQKLWGIQLSSPVEPGTPITVDGKKVGKLTSYTAGKSGNDHFGLGYIKRKAASKGDTVVVGDNISGTVVEVPYLARQRPLTLNSKP